MVKVAMLILAHADPLHLSRLLDMLDAPWIHCFVHIDRKSDAKPFAAATKRRSNCTLIDDQERKDISWGGFSIIEAILLLIRRARAHPSEFDRFTLLSGTDFPAVDLPTMRAAFATSNEYIRINRRLDQQGSGLHDTYANRFSFADFKLLNPRSGHPLLARIAKLAAAGLRRKRFDNFPLYHGSCWWSLTARTIDEIVNLLEADPAVLRWFRYCHVPDEIFFQSLAKQCSTAASIVDDRTQGDGPAREPNLHGMHYIDWRNPNPRLPKVLDLGDLPRIRRSGALFARKVDSAMSSDLVAELSRTQRGLQ